MKTTFDHFYIHLFIPRLFGLPRNNRIIKYGEFEGRSGPLINSSWGGVWGRRRQPSPPQHTPCGPHTVVCSDRPEHVRICPPASRNHHPKDMDLQKSLILELLWISGKCNREQNDLPDPFLTSILIPNGLKSWFGASVLPWGKRGSLMTWLRNPDYI